MRKAILIGMLGLAAACGSTQPPRELVDARAAYQRAARSPGANLAQTDLYEARQSLGRAEAKFSDAGDKQETKDLAYVAQRKAMMAESRGASLAAVQQANQAQAELQQMQQRRNMEARMQLGKAQGELAKSQQQIAAERQARAAADQRALEALASVKEIQTKTDERGLVLTIGGSVLFASGKSTLLPNAQNRLEKVASVIAKENRPIMVIGHTDSTGTDDKNMELSKKRADAVRLFLIQHGVPESRVTTDGAGETQPIADNKTAEGRGMNRRVEIILANPKDTGGMKP
jgi:outer membrane protein OmpA-like peptidoglycan-associated protein